MRFSEKLSMKYKLIILCIGSVLVCSTSLILIVSHLSENSLRTQIVSNLQALSTSQSNEIVESFQKLRKDLKNFSDSKFIQDALVSYESVAYGTGLDLDTDSDISSSSYFKTIQDKYIDNFKDQLSNLPLTSFSILLKNGFTVSQTGETHLLGKNLFKGALKQDAVSACAQSATNDESFFTGLVKENNIWRIYLCQKILSRYDRDGYQKNAHMGYLVAALDWNYFAKLKNFKEGLGQTGQLFLVDHDKVITPPRHLINTDVNTLLSKPLLFKSTDQNYAVTTGFENDEVLFVNKNLNLTKNVNWILVGSIATQEALSSIKSLKAWSYSVLALGLLLVSLISWYFINSLSKQFLKSGYEVTANSDLIYQVCEQLTQISKNVASSTQQQSAALDETSASMEEMNAMLDKTLEMSKSSSDKSGQCSQKAIEGETKMGALVESVNEVSTAISSSFAKVKDSSLTSLNEVLNAFNNIESKTKIINDIAFQTKLLSFNASVEAARAGEHGKGFAVVAEEVGNLANSVNSSATEINTFLEQTRNKIASLIKSSESLIENATVSSNKIINKSRENAGEGMEFFQTLTKLIAEINSESQEVSNAAYEQSKGVTEINKAILEISQSNTNNVNMVTNLEEQIENLANSSESLKIASEQMLKILNGLPKEFIKNEELVTENNALKTEQPFDNYQKAA